VGCGSRTGGGSEINGALTTFKEGVGRLARDVPLVLFAASLDFLGFLARSFVGYMPESSSVKRIQDALRISRSDEWYT
jgi:hypothetical protein